MRNDVNSDQDLVIEAAIAAVRAGDEAAFGRIVDETVDMLGAYIVFIVGDDESVDDILQEVYMRVYRQLGDYTPGTRFTAWIRTMAKYAALGEVARLRDRRKAHGRYVDHLQADIQAGCLAWEDDGRASLETEIKALERCIRKLAGLYRRVVDLHYHEKLRLAEIAVRLDRKVSTVGSLLHRARRHLARCIEMEVAR